MTRNEMRALARQIISDAAAVVTAAYSGQEHRPDMTTAALLAHYVLLEFPPEDSEPVFTLDEVAELLEDTADVNSEKWGIVIIGDEVMRTGPEDSRDAIKAALRKLKRME